MLDPLEMHARNGHAFVYNALYLANTTDTLLIADSVVTGYSGGGYALFTMNTENGDLGWFRTDGWNQGPVPTQFPHRFALSDDGSAFVAGTYGTAVFGTDTLDAPGQSGGGSIAKYDTTGALLWVRGYEAVNGSVGFAAISKRSGGGLQVVGSMVGSVSWDGIDQSVDTRELLLAAFLENGECIGIESDIGPSVGVSIHASPEGLYLTGAFPPYTPPIPPLLPITIGSSTYNTFGWTDAFIAKHSLNVGGGIPSYRSVEADGLHIYANPNRGSFRLEMPDAFANERDLVLRIYDSTGRMVLEQQLDMRGEPAHMDVFDAVPGLYNVTLTDGHSTCSGSMVVE